MQDESYLARLRAEESVYKDCARVHNLPAIFHYWSNRYIRPKLESFGFIGPNEMFRRYLAEQCDRRKNDGLRFASIGSGNCDLEVQVAVHLRAIGHSDFVIDCLDLNTTMLERGRSAASREGVAGHLNFIQADLNQWNPEHQYDAVMANQALHHVLNLECLFANIESCLQPHGSFIISDMIGRNGNQRWPEALDIVHEFWRKLPPSYRFNQQLERYEELFENWDCSGESFEGIRSQDILPLLLNRFHFQFFAGFANVIDPFVDRSFGHNFDATASWDRAFIDEVHARDEKEMLSGHIKPTHMLAVVGKNRDVPAVFLGALNPSFWVRSTGSSDGEQENARQTEQHSRANAVVVRPSQPDALPQDAFDWHAWPHSSQSELEISCRRLQNSANRIKELTKDLEGQRAWALGLEKELEGRTAWALGLQKELEERTARVLGLQNELEERTAWALRLNKELEQLAWTRNVHPRVVKFCNSAVLAACYCRNRVRQLLFRDDCSE